MAVAEHRIVAVTLSRRDGCARCAENAPHNVLARCACGAIACGSHDHIWLVERREADLVWLTPSFHWLNAPGDPSKGAHLHEFIAAVPVVKIDMLHR